MSFRSSELVSGARTFGVELSPAQVEHFQRYALLLEKWNERMNLTRVPPEQFIGDHFLDSLSVAPFVKPTAALLDIGTGAGFPGIPLKIALPEIHLTVLDSVRKKLLFVEALSRELSLHVTTIAERAEVAAHLISMRERFDAVTARAVAPLPQLVHWMLPFAIQGGVAIAMKGPGYESELENCRSEIERLGGQVRTVAPVQIPTTSRTHVLIIIDKVLPTPENLPHKGNKRKRKP